MADYAISNVPRRVVYAASGTGPYAFTFEILSQTDIAVYKASTLLTLTTDYTVTINANGTGSVTLVATAGTSNITIVGAKNIQRTTDFTTGGDLFANTLNDELDNQTIFIQQVAETAERGLKAPVVDPTDINMTLPAKASRVGTVLAFNATTGNPEAGPSIGSVTTVAAQSANINTVATNIASVNTVAGNITNVNTVAGVSSNVTAVATNIANVNAVGADLLEATSEINTVAVDIANVNTVGNNIASVNTVAGEIGAGQDVTVVAANLSGADTIGTVATNIANVNATGTNIANVNAVGADLLEAVSEINTVATDITNVNTVGTNIASVNTVAGVSGAVSTVAGISANVTTVAGVSSNVTTVAGISSNVTTVAGIAANVTTVAGNSANVTIAATNVADINNFADVYQGAKATDPTLRNDGSALQSGDLYFNTTDDVMKVRESGAWLAAYASLSGALIAVNNLSDVASASAARTNLGLGTGNTPTFTGLITGAGSVSAPAITTTGDTNTGIFFPAADTIAFAEGGVESMRIDSAGRVGIGASSPSFALDVATADARIRVAPSTTTNLALFQATNGAGSGYVGLDSNAGGLTGSQYVLALWHAGNYATVFGTNNAERMRITSAGDVGIGRTNPGFKLDIAVSAGGNAFNVTDLATSDFRVVPGVSSAIVRVGPASGGMAFYSSDSERMRITSGGDVCIGTITSNAKITVESNGGQMRLRNTTTRYRSDFSVGASGGVNINAYDDTGGAYNTVALDGNPVTFNISGTERMRVNQFGAGLNGAIPTSGMGITFPSAQSNSSNANTLDDYEEGTWTPTDGSGAGLSFTTVTAGAFVKIGRLVVAMCAFTYPSTVSGLGATIAGLPFTALDSSSGFDGGTTRYTTYSSMIMAAVNPSQSTAALYVASGAQLSNVQLSGIRVDFVIIYRAN
jgi:hypothetical protein